VNQLDQTAFAILGPDIRDAFHLSNQGFLSLVALTQVGGLLLAIPLAYSSDRLPRVAIALAGAAVWALFGLFKGAQFVLDRPARNLVVEGTFQRVTPLQIEAAVMNGHDAGFVSTDLGELRRRVKAIDWVDRVNVGRSWPDTLIVRVTEHQAAARWGENGLLNVRGELFTEQAQHEFPELPRLAGPRGSASRR